MKKSAAIFTVFIILIFSQVSCSTSEPDDIKNDSNTGKSDDDTEQLPDGEIEDKTTLPDNGENPDEEIIYEDGYCDCFGTKYKIPDKYKDVEGWCKADEDGDTIPNCIEVPTGVFVDTDEDGTPDYKDTDSDGDGIPDSVEGYEDADGDGTPNYRDLDSDGDNIPDSVECPDQPCRDTDEDGIPDYLDIDSDGDGIPDIIEGVKDSDNDGTPNYLDLDSDGDGIYDEIECPSQPCADSDDDGFPDYLDLDSDNDGIPDKDEMFCLNLSKSCRIFADCDGDGVDDNTELAAGSDPCVSDPEFYEGQFYVILPYEDPEKKDYLKFGTQIKMADIVISLDLSGSMAYARDNIKQDIKNVIISGIKAAVPDPAFAISSYSNIESYPYIMNQTITKNETAIQNALNSLSGEGGGEIESQYEAVYQAVTGAGFDGDLLRASWDVNKWVEDFYRVYSEVRIPAQDCSTHLGSIGGACFRQFALPIIMLITDEQLYDINKDWVSDTNGVVTKLRYKWRDSKPDKGHYESATIAALNAKKAKFIGVIGQGIGDLLFSLRPRMEKLANDTGSKNGTTGDPYVFQIDMAGKGLSNQIVEAVTDLLNNIKMDIDTTSESVTNVHGIDTTLFIKDLVADHSDPPNAYESKSGATFKQVKPGVFLFFDITFQNTIFEPTTTENTLFRAKITVYGEGALLDTRDVFIIVPGIKDDGGIQS